MLGAPVPAGGQTWTVIGFSGSPPTNPGTSRQSVGSFLIWNRNANDEVTLNIGVQWGSASGQARDKIVSAVNLGTDAEVMSKTFQLAISYLGDFDGLTNSFDNGTAMMRVDLYDGNGALLASSVQSNVTAGDPGQSALITGLGGGPEMYPQWLSNQQISHLGVLDYGATQSRREIVYLMDSLAWYDTFDGARNAVVPEPAALALLAPALLIVRRRQRIAA